MILPSRPSFGRPAVAGLLFVPLATLSLAAQALPGIPRAHRFDSSGQALPNLIAGEFTGDGRADALVVREQGVDLLHGVAGFGARQRIPSPNDGAVAHVARIVAQGEGGRDLALLCVSSGSAAGLHTLEVDDGKIATSTALGAPVWGGVRELVVLEEDAHAAVYGLSADGASVYTGTLRNRVWTAGPTVALAQPAAAIRVSPWASATDRCLFACSGAEIEILTTDGAAVESIRTTLPIHDFDVALSEHLGFGRLAVITGDDANGDSWFELYGPGGQLQQQKFLGVAKPRIVVRDLLDRGDVDVCAVNTHGPNGFAVFGGFGATPTTFDFEGAGIVPFDFASPGFGTAAAFSNVDLFDADGDGDGDVLFSDTVEGAVWVQPSWAIHEFQRAPTVATITPQYSHQNPAWQWIAFEFALPTGHAGLYPTHAEVLVYQQRGTGDGAATPQLVANEVVDVNIQPGNTFNTGALKVYGQYEGPEGTDADYVVCVRLLEVDETQTSWHAYGVESFTYFHHSRTPHGRLPGVYIDGAAGGVNPLPSVGGPPGGPNNGAGNVPPPPPPPSGD